MPIELSATHCHLEQLDAGALDEAAAAGVTTIVAVAQDAGSMRAVLDLASRFPGRVLPGLGIHPCTVTDRGLEALAPDLTLLIERAADAAVIGVPSRKWGETPVGFVRLVDDGASTDAILAAVNSRLGKTQRLAQLHAIEEMPRSHIGKLLKTELREEAERRGLPD